MNRHLLAANHGHNPRPCGLLGRPMSNANAGDLGAIQASFERYHAETMAMRTEIGEIGADLDKMHMSIAALSINGGGQPASSAKHPDMLTFKNHLRSGAVGIKSGMTEGSDPDGGYIVPVTVDSVIQNQLISLSPLRGYASIVTLGKGAGSYSFNVNRRGTTSGWAGETDARPETKTPALANITPAEGEVYANPKISQWLLDDVGFDVASFLQTNISDEFSIQEGAAFTNGNGVLKPRGFMTYPAVLTGDTTRAFGTLQYIKTGAANNFVASTSTVSPADVLYSMVYTLRAPYRAGPGVAWFMNSMTASVVRQFKDTIGRYIWADSLQAGQPAMLAGYPVAIDENMPDIGAGAFPIAFGNWNLGYRIVDRLGTRIIRDPLTQKPFVLFYTTKRVGGSLADSNAIKLLKCEA